MPCRMRWSLAAVVLGACLLLPARASAQWPIANWLKYPDCPKSEYSCWHFWAPEAVRGVEHHRRTSVSVYAPDRFPCVPPRSMILRYPCPAIDPAEAAQSYYILHQ